MLWFTQKPVRLLCGMMLGAAALGSHAAGLQISPTGLSLPAKQRAGIFTLTNTGGQPLTAQVRVYRWDQDENGKDVLTPSKEVIASPPMVKLAAGGVQQFRVIRTKPAVQAEEAYRLVVDELPPPQAKQKKGLQFVLRYSVPLFLNQTENPEAALQWHIRNAPGGRMLLTAANTGTAHAQLSNIAVQTGKGRHNLVNGLAGYALPGKTWQYSLDSSASAAVRQGKLSVTVNGRTVQPEVRFAAR